MNASKSVLNNCIESYKISKNIVNMLVYYVGNYYNTMSTINYLPILVIMCINENNSIRKYGH